MLIALTVFLSLAFIGWIIYRVYRAVKGTPITAHLVMYWLSSLTGIFTLSFFLTMDIERIIKILVCIVLGAVFIFLAAYIQRRKQPSRRSAGH